MTRAHKQRSSLDPLGTAAFGRVIRPGQAPNTWVVEGWPFPRHVPPFRVGVIVRAGRSIQTGPTSRNWSK